MTLYLCTWQFAKTCPTETPSPGRKMPIWRVRSWLRWLIRVDLPPPPHQGILGEWEWNYNSRGMANSQRFPDHSRVLFPVWQREWTALLVLLMSKTVSPNGSCAQDAAGIAIADQCICRARIWHCLMGSCILLKAKFGPPLKKDTKTDKIGEWSYGTNKTPGPQLETIVSYEFEQIYWQVFNTTHLTQLVRRVCEMHYKAMCTKLSNTCPITARWEWVGQTRTLHLEVLVCESIQSPVWALSSNLWEFVQYLSMHAIHGNI